MKYFQVKVQYDHTIVEGQEPKASKPEVYIVDALSFTEAEARIIKEITPYSVGGIQVTSESKTSISEIIKSDKVGADKWYKGKVMFISLDNDKEKRVPCFYLIEAEDFDGALMSLKEKALKGMQADFEIASLTETNILEVYEYEAPAEGTEKGQEEAE